MSAQRVRTPPPSKRVDVMLLLDPDPDGLVLRVQPVYDVHPDRVCSTAALAAKLVGLDYYGYTVRERG